MIEEQKEWIDSASYEDLLRHWRLAPTGDPLFQNEVGDYYAEVMKRKRNGMSSEEYTTISKRIGWEGNK
jgi:hypothetical protein